MEKPVPKRFLARSFSNVCELAAGQLEPRTHQPRTPAGTTNPSKPPAAHPPTADQQQLATPSNFWKQCRSTSHAASRAGPHPPAAGKSRCADEVWEGHPDSVTAHRDAACVQNTATPPTPHGSPATDPPRLSSTACRGKISAKCHQSMRPTTYQDRMAEFKQPYRGIASNFAVQHLELAPQPITPAVILPL